jgi:hypothetical protein
MINTWASFSTNDKTGREAITTLGDFCQSFGSISEAHLLFRRAYWASIGKPIREWNGRKFGCMRKKA